MATENLIGKTVGKYRIVEQLGRGGMAEVYKAYQPSLDRYVAIKVMHPFLSEDKDFLARFEREAKLVASLRHPNIVQVHDFDVEGGVCYLVMEFIDGETLKARLQKLEEQNQWISIDDAVRIIVAIDSALKYAHRMGLVHRDIKPANVMIDKQGNVILTDLGIARIFAGGAGAHLTATGAMVGTPSYMAPEQGMGQPGDERSDVYSLGVMLYQLVTARLPFEADTPLAIVLKHINAVLPMPRQMNPNVPESIERILLKAMAKNPDDRYQHVGDMQNALKGAAGLSSDETPLDAMIGRTVPRIMPSGTTLAGAGATIPFPSGARAAESPSARPTIIAQQPASPPTSAAPTYKAKLGWKGILAGVRTVLSRGTRSKQELPEKAVSKPARLRLDSAVPDQVDLGRTFDLAVAVRQVSSPPLTEDGLARIQSGEVQVAWHPTEPYSHLRIQVSAPDCEIQGTDSHSFRLYPGQDSPVFYFQLIPKKLGEISIVVRVYQEDDWLGSTRVHTAAREQVIGHVQIETASHTVSVHRTDDISNKRLPDQVNLTNLRQILTTYFDDSELRDVCFFELRVDYDGLRGEGKEAKIRELIAYCERHGRISELVDICKQLRPNVRDQA